MYLIILILIAIRVSMCSCGECGCEPLAEVWWLLHTWKFSMYDRPTKTGSASISSDFGSMGRDPSASLSLDDSRSWACQAGKPVGVRGSHGQSGFYNGNGYFKAKSPTCIAAVAPRLIHNQQFKLFSQSQSAAVLDSSGSKCSSLLLYIHIKVFSLLLSSPDPCPRLMLSRLLIPVLQHVWIFYYLLAECNHLQFPRFKKRSSFEKKIVMEHPQVEMGPEHSWWLGDFNLLNVSGLMAIQHDWWLPASCYCCGWKGCLLLEDRKLSWATQRAISCDLLIIFFFPQRFPNCWGAQTPGEKTALCTYACLYICYKRSIQKYGVCKRTLCIRRFLCCKVVLNLTSARLFLFKRFRLHLSSQLDTALKYFSVFLIFVVVLLRATSGPVRVGEQWFKKRKKPIWFSLICWNDQNIS